MSSGEANQDRIVGARNQQRQRHGDRRRRNRQQRREKAPAPDEVIRQRLQIFRDAVEGASHGRATSPIFAAQSRL